MIDKYNIKDTVDMTPEKEQIVIKPISRPRDGWEDAFKEMNKSGDDKLLIEDVFDDENQGRMKIGQNRRLKKV